jgi:putative ATP-binding cassette transporter
MAEKKATVRRETLHRLRQVVAIFLRSRVGTKAKLLFGTLLLMMFCMNGLNVLNSYVGRNFMSAIEARDLAGFRHHAWLYGAVFAASSVSPRPTSTATPTSTSRRPARSPTPTSGSPRTSAP